LKIGIKPECARKLEAGETITIKDFKVTSLYSIPPNEKPDTTHFGFVFDFGFARLYNMGDSNQAVVDEPMAVLREVSKFTPEIVMLPIVGDYPGRRYEDAFKFAKILHPKIAIPCHYDCFADRTIDPRIFADLFKDIRDIKPVIIDYKGKYVYARGRSSSGY
jgi:L-ascorbate 6-phosphate lactonase